MASRREPMENRNTAYNTPYSVKRSGYSGGPNHANKYHTHHFNRKLKSLQMEKRRRNAPKPSYGKWIALGVVALLFAVLMFRVGDKTLHPASVVDDSKEAALAHSAQITSSQFWTKAQRDQKLWLINYSGQYPEELKLFANHYSQVLDYCFRYPSMKDADLAVDLSEEADSDEVPLLIQWDDRWGYSAYGNELIGYAGCGPTSLSMVALYLLGDPSLTPEYLCELSVAHDYYRDHQGTEWTLISEGCEYIGLTASECQLNESSMKAALDANHPLIVIVGPGDFTLSGHFMVIAGYDETGFIVNDPNSRDTSAKTWTFEQLRPQINGMWEMAVA